MNIDISLCQVLQRGEPLKKKAVTKFNSNVLITPAHKSIYIYLNYTRSRVIYGICFKLTTKIWNRIWTMLQCL